MKLPKIKQNSTGSDKGIEIEDHIFSITQEEAARIEMPLEKKKLRLLWWLIFCVLLILAGRVFYLNIIRGAQYQEIARGNSIRSIIVKAPRGKIFDRYGTELVSNVPSLDAIVIPADLPRERNKIKEEIASLSDILSINEGEITAKFESADRLSLNPLLLKENISQDESLILLERIEDFPGIRIEKTAIRNYADSYIFSHILGYVGKMEKKEMDEHPDYLMTDYVGKSGIEKSYEKYLRGVHGAIQVEVDSLGNIKQERGLLNPKPGSDLVLGIDADLQKKIFDSLTTVLEKTQTKTAAAVAINPQNGEVLALVSLPSFDNNLFSRKVSSDQYAGLLADKNLPLFNRAISGEYPPGSTLKPAVAAAALTEGTIDSSTTVNCGGGISIGSYHYGDWKTHGVTDIKKAIAESCDVFFYSVGGGYGNISGLGINRMKRYENAFGLGSVTGIDLTGEESGFIPDESWKLERTGEKWYIGNSYHAAIGQGYITATPLQLVNYIAAIANGGMLYQPHLLLKTKPQEGEAITNSAKVIRDNIVSSNIVKIVKEGMRQTVTSGTAQTLKDLPVAVAGKTGTAQFGSENKTHAWFVSFAPYENPEIALAVLVEGGGESNSSALPVTKEVYQWYFSGRK